MPVKAPKNGYVYVYLSNRSDQNVYFDNFKVQVQQGNLIEENHYYAYGLKIASISSVKLGDGAEGGLQNNYQYQGSYSELDADIGWNDFDLRNYDAQTGRWVQPDPYQQYPSPYTGMGNDPVNNVDPDGGGVLGLTPGLFTAVTTLSGAIIGGDISAASGGSFWKGAAIGAAVGFAAGYIPSLVGGGVSISLSHAMSIFSMSVHAVGIIKDFTNQSGGVKSASWTSQWGYNVHQTANHNAIYRQPNSESSQDDDKTLRLKLKGLDDGTEWADDPENQTGSRSFQHAMRNGDVHQSVKEAMALADAFVREKFRRAIELKKQGKVYNAYHVFAMGLHALQDATSPAHHGFQPWGDHVGIEDVISHILKEYTYPGLDSNLQQITNQYYNWFENPNRAHLPTTNLFSNIKSD